MAFEDVLNRMGSGMKHLTDRYTEYGAPVQDHQVVYAYEPPSQSHEASSKHNYSSGHKNNAAMSALTLLAFLFFLHILQQCIKDHMAAMSTPQITIMTAGRETEDALKKSKAKIDKAGIKIDSEQNTDYVRDKRNKIAYETQTFDDDKHLTRINTAMPPKNGYEKYLNADYDTRLTVSGNI